MMNAMSGGPLLKEIIDNMVKKKEGLLDRKVTLYSGHDTTVSNFLHSLGLYNFINPPFSSAVLIELRTSPNNQYFVNVCNYLFYFFFQTKWILVMALDGTCSKFKEVH
jgi:hypothetical protein